MVAASVPLHCTELQLGRFDAAGRAELSGVVRIRNKDAVEAAAGKGCCSISL